MGGEGKSVSAVPPSNNYVSRRTDEMATDLEEKLYYIKQNCEFSLQMDKFTRGDNDALLMASQIRISRCYQGSTVVCMLFAHWHGM